MLQGELQGKSVLAHSGLGQRLLGWQALQGGVSAAVYKMSYEVAGGAPAHSVVRCHSDVDFARNPDLAADEYACVTALHEANVSVPQPLYLGLDTEVFGRPYAIYEYVEGSPVSDADGLSRCVPAMAAWLANFHTLSLPQLNPALSTSHPLVPRQALVPLAVGDATRSYDQEIFESQIREALDSIPRPAPVGEPVLLHGDYWSGNLLWRNSQLVAVIDWEDFGIGDALADLACARLELLWGAGVAEVDRFTQLYFAAGDLNGADRVEALAWWDLAAVLPFANTLGTISSSTDERLEKRALLAGFIRRAAAVLGLEKLLLAARL